MTLFCSRHQPAHCREQVHVNTNLFTRVRSRYSNPADFFGKRSVVSCSNVALISARILVDLNSVSEHRLRISFAFQQKLFFHPHCYCELHRHHRVTSGAHLGTPPMHYSVVRRKRQDKIPKWGMTGAKPLWEGKGRVRKIQISLLSWQSLHFAPVCGAEGVEPNPITASRSFMPEYIKTNSFLNCFHTERERERAPH